MRTSDREPATNVNQLFDALVRELHAAGYVLSFGAEGLGNAGPYVQILNPPERRRLAKDFDPSNRTIIRLHPFDTYLRYLENSFPRLFEPIAAACRPRRPFLVLEGWMRYVVLGQRLLAFAREHGLNLRCVDFARGESRLNGLRIYFDHGAHQWRGVEGAVEDLLRDPRRSQRTWLSSLDPRWRMGRAVGRVNNAARKAASVILT